MAFKRDLFTGEVVEVASPEGGREILYRQEIPPHLQQRRTRCNPWRKPWVGQSVAVNPKQVDHFNQELADHSVSGAHYDPSTGNLVCESRRARREAVRLRGFHDHNGGYSDP